MRATIYHNPRCSKSRQTLKLLKDRNITIEIIEYLKTPIARETLDQILRQLNLQPSALLRKNEKIYLELKNQLNNEDDIIQAMLEYPILIERPIVVIGNKAAIGRPPEAVLQLFSCTES